MHPCNLRGHAAPCSVMATLLILTGSSGLVRAGQPADAQRRGGDRWATMRQFEIAFGEAAEKIEPSVVSITSTRVVNLEGQPEISPFPFEFFGDRFEQLIPRQRGPERREQYGLGSGVIVDERGYILTNNHVIAEADEVQVQLVDRKTYDAEIIGTDPKTDLAVVRIDAPRLRAAALADSSRIRVGRWVLAVGSPFGLKHTVTAGIISAKGREGLGIADYEDLIQTDAAINRGNSGGPLINLDGDVVGINTAIASRTGGNQGIGFAIPSNMARFVMNSLIETGAVRRGWLGVTIQDLSEGLARSFGFASDKGVLIGDVATDTPADEAGLQSGDIIVAIEDEPVVNVSELRRKIARTPPGEEVAVKLWRDDGYETITVQLGEMPDTRVATGRQQQSDDNGQLGLRLADTTADLRQRLGLPQEVTGAVVVGVTQGTPAADAGLRPGEVITHVNRQRVRSAAEAQATLRSADVDEGVRLRLRSAAGSRFAYIQKE